MRKSSLFMFLLIVVAVPLAYGDQWEAHVYCEGAQITDQPYDSGYLGSPPVVQEAVILTTKYRTNMTESPTYKWTISYKETNEHSWEVTGEVEASIKTGMLTKIITEGGVKVTVGGAYSGKKEHEWQVTDEIIIAPCKRYKFECFIDKVSASRWREMAEFRWECPVHYPGQAFLRNREICNGSANGQENEDGGFKHVSNYTQPCPHLDCPPDFHDE